MSATYERPFAARAGHSTANVSDVTIEAGRSLVILYTLAHDGPAWSSA
ncbi:MAG: hypothetical protein HY054_07550 [Proteobacteria bacterium]|nr:hypothetical protein [Pseudomonadota bacterium]